jgi:Lipocalin-like domain
MRMRNLLVPLAVAAMIGAASSAAARQGTTTSSAPQSTAAPGPARPAIVATMSDLMVKVIYPASDAIFYITTRQPASESEWDELQGKALLVAESANLLMMPGRARDEDRWMQDAKLMLDVGRAAYRAARAKDLAALEALNDQLYESCTSCHQHYRPNYGRRPSPAAAADAQAASPAPPVPPAPPDVKRQTIEGRWKLRAAEDIRADGSVARYPWGKNPLGSIVVEGGFCYLQIMSSDTPSFTASTPKGEQMKATLLSSYIAYSGPCMTDEAEGSVTLKVEAAWRPDYVGTEQKRFFRFENGTLLFGPATGSIRAGNETLTRRLTLDRVQ